MDGKPYKNRRTAGRRLSHVACDFNMLNQPGSDPEKATGSCFLLIGGFGVSWVWGSLKNDNKNEARPFAPKWMPRVLWASARQQEEVGL